MDIFVLEYCDAMGLMVVMIDRASFSGHIFAIIIMMRFVVILAGIFAMI